MFYFLMRDTILMQDWFSSTDNELSAKSSVILGCKLEEEAAWLKSKHDDMSGVRERVKAVQTIQEEFLDMGNPKLLTTLKEYVRAVESRWSRTVTRLQKRLDKAREEDDGAGGAAAKVPDFDRLNLSASRERTLSSGNDAEDPLLVGKHPTIRQELLSMEQEVLFSFRISDDFPGS